ncbi:hypothetical protein HDU79_003454 [Rhizoclosmatium sp. JEL0117]|nr:hypothetical protein HDU79_003454 [Rhizoclosmatium sp. JEL0117]
MDQQYAQSAMYACATMAFVSLGLFAALVIEIARNEVPKERMSILRSVATPFNICLELMAFSLILIFASESAVLIILNDKSQQNQLIIRQAFRSWGIALFKLTYLHYSYVRTYPIIEQEFPRAVWPVWVFMGASTVVTVIPTLCRTLRIWIPLEILLTIKNHASVSTVHMDPQLVLPSLCFCAAMACVSLGLLFAVIFEIVVHHIPKKRTLPIFFYSAESVVLGTLLDTSLKHTLSIVQTVRSWGTSLFKITYLSYSYVRTYPIVEQEFPSAVSPVWLMVVTTNIVIAVPAICRIVLIWKNNDKILLAIKNYTSVATDICLSIMDAIFLFAFVKFLNTTQNEVGVIDKHFIIISRYGIASVIAFTLLTVLDFVYINTNDEVFIVLGAVLFTIIFLILGVMKIALRRQKDKEVLEKRSRVENARRMSMGGTVMRSQDTVIYNSLIKGGDFF